VASRSRAQAAARERRIAILGQGSAAESADLWAAFRERMHELGHVEGRTLRIDPHWARGAVDQLPAIARGLVDAAPEVVVVSSTPAAQAAMQATRTIPIVLVGVGDPVGTGLVASLAHPGGNVTGVSAFLSDIAAKRLELLHQAVPRARRFALLAPASNSAVQRVLPQLEDAARQRGVSVRLVDAFDPASIRHAFNAMAADGVDALLVGAIPAPYGPLIFELALECGVPAAQIYLDQLAAGALLTYGPDRLAPHRRAADYVHRILQGARPADLPVEQPTQVWIGVNLKTARALGLTLPRAILVRADRVID
jgi:putative ABC transport system substrate-binding protein